MIINVGDIVLANSFILFLTHKYSSYFLRNPNAFLGDEERRFAFETSAWQRCVQINVELTQVKRQSDQNLVSILNKVVILREKLCNVNLEGFLKSI